MSLNKIRFSHEYSKMPFPDRLLDRTVLLEVLVSDTGDLHNTFVNYDTHIRGKNPALPDAYYKLPSGKVMILILKSYHKFENLIEHRASEVSGIWTTIRRWTPQKEQYYKSIRGEEVEIEIME